MKTKPFSEREKVIFDILRATDGSFKQGKKAIGKHKKMASNPFRLMRGSAPLFYRDLMSCEEILKPVYEAVPLTTVQGDCHVANLGFITEEGSHGDNVIFALNDFDDACIGHSLWDLLRFSMSLHLTVDYLQGVRDQRYSNENEASFEGMLAPSSCDAEKAVAAFLDRYITTCHQIMIGHESHHRVIDSFAKSHVLYKSWKKAKKRAAGGKLFTEKSALAKAAVWTDKNIQFDLSKDRFAEIPLLVKEALIGHFAPFMDDAIIDAVVRLDAGTGSVNLQRYYLLVGPEKAKFPRDLSICHVVEVKQQRHAAPLADFSNLSPTNRLSPAHLTRVCQRRMQRQSDLLLDATLWENTHWLVRSRHHARVGVDLDVFLEPVSSQDMQKDTKKATQKESAKTDNRLVEYAKTCGDALALAHSRGDRRSTRFEQAVCKVLPDKCDMLSALSQKIAKQACVDWELLNRMLHQ